MKFEDLKFEDVDGMSDAEVAAWFAEVQRREQLEHMRSALKSYLDVKEQRTIKFPG